MQAATRIGIYRIFFCEVYLYLQKFLDIVADGVTFLLKHRAIVFRTLLNAMTNVLMRMF